MANEELKECPECCNPVDAEELETFNGFCEQCHEEGLEDDEQ